MYTDIQSNGSKWAGEEPDSLETLLQVLESFPLRREMTSCGDFIQTRPVWVGQGWNEVDEVTGALVKCYVASDEQPEAGSVHFSGNFFNLSHVFSIYTNEPAVIESLTKAIRANQERADYQAQPEPAPSSPYFIIRKNGKMERFA